MFSFVSLPKLYVMVGFFVIPIVVHYFLRSNAMSFIQKNVKIFTMGTFFEVFKIDGIWS